MLTLKAFGALDVRDASGRTLEALLSQPKRAALFTYLAVTRPGELHRRDAILALFWPELDEAHGRACLRQALSFLRRQLGAGIIVTRGADEVGVDDSAVQTDVSVFRDALAREDWAAALDAYKGDFLEGLYVRGAAPFIDWVDRTRAPLQRAAADAAWRHAQKCIASGALLDAEQAALRAAALIPADEASLRAYLLSLGAVDRAAAIQFYEGWATLLAADLEIDPSEATQTTAKRLRDGLPLDPPAAFAEEASGDATHPRPSTSEPRGEEPAGFAPPAPPLPLPPPAGRTSVPVRTATARTGTGGAPGWPKATAPIAVLALLAIVVGGWLRSHGATTGAPDGGARGGASAAGADLNAGSIVLPFVNHTPEDSLTALGSMVADYVAGQLSRNGIGWVVPRQTVRDLSERRGDASAVRYFARTSGAHYVVTGAYYMRGDTLVVQGEVTDGETARLIASVGPVEGSRSEVIRATAEQVLIVLARVLDPGAPPPGLRGMPATFAAYREYAKALDLWEAGEWPRTLEHLDRALQADSTYVEALLLASVTERLIGDRVKADSITQVAQRYRDRMSPWDQVGLDAQQGWLSGDLEAVYRAGRRARELDPVRGGGDLGCRGARQTNRLHEAVENCLRAHGVRYRKAGLIGLHWRDLLVSLHLLGEHEAELEYARQARGHNPSEPMAFIFEARALAALGRTEDLRTLLDEAKTHGEPGFYAWEVIREAGEELRLHRKPHEGDELVRESLLWYRARELATTPDTPRFLLLAGDYAGARALCRDRLRSHPADVDCLGIQGCAAAALGDSAAGRRASQRLEEIESHTRSFGRARARRAEIEAQLGHRAEAVRLLRAAYEEGAEYGIWLHNDRPLEVLRGYPPFERFVASRD